MAKLSVYVPDDLLEQVRRSDPALRPSQVLQEALQARLPGAGDRPYSTLNEALVAERDAARRIVQARAAEAYSTGYRVGLKVAVALPWRAFEDLVGLNWDLSEWVENFDSERYDIATPTDDEQASGVTELDWEMVLDSSMGGDFIPTSLGERAPIGISGEGFRDALRGLWISEPSRGPVSASSVAATGEDQ